MYVQQKEAQHYHFQVWIANEDNDVEGEWTIWYTGEVGLVHNHTRSTFMYHVSMSIHSINKLAKLRRHASRVHFAKYTLDKYTLEKYT